MNERKSSKMNRRQALQITLGSAGISGLAASGALGAAATPSAVNGKSVLVCLGEFSEGMEAYYMIYRLIEEGIKPVVAATAVKRLQMVVHDFEPQYSNYTEKPGYQIQTDLAYEDVDANDYDGVLIPGGRGPEEIRQNPKVLRLIGHFLDKKLPLGAMCHGPQVLYAARPLKGRRVAAYHGIRADVELAGATFVDQPVVVDGALVTSRGWPDLPYFMPKFLDVLRAG